MAEPSGTILLVEDDLDLAGLMSEYLEAAGFRVCHRARGDGAAAEVERERPDLVILDVMLPGLDGVSVCREIRRRSGVAILMLTALGEDVDQIVGLEVGADDYLVKPVRPRLLLARARALLRRTGGALPPDDRVIACGPVRIDLPAREVRVEGEAVELTTAEFDLLALLAAHRGEVVSRESLHQELRGVPYDGLDRSIDLRVSRVRAKLGPRGAERLKSVRAQGYVLTEEPS